MFICIYKCLTILHCTRQSSDKITISGLIKADVLQWITAIQSGWQFDTCSSVVWLKYQDYENERIQLEYDSCRACYTLNINSRLQLQ